MLYAALTVFAVAPAFRLWPAHDPEIVEHAHSDLPASHPHVVEHARRGAHAHAFVIDPLHRRWPA